EAAAGQGPDDRAWIERRRREASGGVRAKQTRCRRLRGAAHRGQRRDDHARRPRRGVDPAASPFGRLGAQLRQPSGNPVLRRRRGRVPGQDAGVQPPAEARRRL
ncbi:MAG: Putative oxidoreductase, partial [uncultured Nocardioidaceae bacterium]